ncbi:dihydrofolate reductase family protein [Kribbella sp. NPDC026611]|uniref:dihydrofolate reductase family protein n=1 Tax=Kribbella sp. NPDC026611 TaxID=3154911 RepID=UPI0033E45D86
MRKLIESTYITLNGVVDSPQNWGGQYWDADQAAYAESLMDGVEAQVLGRATYEAFADVWPQRTGDPFSDHFNAMPKYVASRTVTDWKWNAQPLQGDAVEAVRKLKAEDGGDLIKYGTGSFSNDLLEAKLVDEYHFWYFPIVIEGENVFNSLSLTHFDLLGTTTCKSGVVIHKFAPKA